MTRLHVAIDARTLQDRPLTGVGRMLVHLLPGLDEHADVELLLHEHGPVPDHPATHVLGAPSRRWSVWLETAVPRFLATHDGIFHSPYYGLPRVGRTPSVVTIHGLSFEHHPEWYGRAHRLAYRSQTRHAARVARAVLTPSQHVAREVVERYGVPPDRILVAPHAVPPHFRPHSAEEVAATRARYDLPSTYLVALGGRHRRRVDVALAVRDELAAHGVDLPLLVMGGDPVPTSERVLQRHALPDDDWAAVLAGAELLLYPTRYEGFGFPAIEALASGTPVVATRVASLPEVLGDAAAWAHDDTVPSFTAAAHDLLTDPARHRELVDHGLRRADGRRSWEPSVRTHLEAYRLAAGGPA